MESSAPLPVKIGNLLATVVDSARKNKDGLMPRLAMELLGHADLGSVGKLAAILQDLQAMGKINLPASASKAADFTPAFATAVQTVLSGILTAAGHPGLAIASDRALELLRDKAISACGAAKPVAEGQVGIAQAVSGPTVERDDNDRDVILYFIEQDEHDEPLLPLVDGSRMKARTALRKAFGNWTRKLRLATIPISDPTKAHLIVTGAEFGESTSMLARTDIGPPRGQQLRMVFNISKTFPTMDAFEANASHEFGHALGIFHEDVDMNDESLVMHDTLLGVKVPTDADLEAAKLHEWRLS